jgi:hypothetical protein
MFCRYNENVHFDALRRKKPNTGFAGVRFPRPNIEEAICVSSGGSDKECLRVLSFVCFHFAV